MKIDGMIKNNGDDRRFSVDCFADIIEQMPGVPFRTLHKKRNKKVWLDTGIVEGCDLVELWRYDAVKFRGEIHLPAEFSKLVIKWEFALCHDIQETHINESRTVIKKARLMAVEVMPIIHRPASIFHNDNPVPGT